MACRPAKVLFVCVLPLVSPKAGLARLTPSKVRDPEFEIFFDVSESQNSGWGKAFTFFSYDLYGKAMSVETRKIRDEKYL